MTNCYVDVKQNARLVPTGDEALLISFKRTFDSTRYVGPIGVLAIVDRMKSKDLLKRE